jgi:hypothetical protein
MLTFKFLPYKEIEDLSTTDRLTTILEHVKENEIVLLEGRLEPEEETKLIAKTMQEVDEDFSGIEISVLHQHEVGDGVLEQVKGKIVNFLLGNSYGFTLIGSAEVIKEVEQHPDKIQFFAEDSASE